MIRSGVDYSYDPPAPESIALSGRSFAVRYLSSNPLKNLTADEGKALSAVNVDVVLVWEDGAQSALLGFERGVADATEALRQAVGVAPGPVPAIYFAVDFQASLTQLPQVGQYFEGVNSVLGPAAVKTGAYGSWLTLAYLLDQRLIGYAWQTYAWSSGLWLRQAHLRQTLNNQKLGGGTVDYDEAQVAEIGQWRWPVTYAPADLLNVRSYVQGKTGLDANSLGIAGDASHATTGGYHEGRVDLDDAGRLGYDYSVIESPRDSHPTDGASAFDLGDFSVTIDGRTLDRHAVTRAVLDALNAGDLRTRDIREMIYSLDDVTVHRWDRLGIRSTGDDSHLWHTHWSFHRDSEGRRDDDDNFLGLLREIFEGPKPEEDDMPQRDRFSIEPGVGVVTPVTLMAPVGSTYAYKKATLSVCNPINRGSYRLRLYWSSGNAQGALAQIPPVGEGDTVTITSGAEKQWQLDLTVRAIRVERVPVDASDLCDYPLSGVVVYE